MGFYDLSKEERTALINEMEATILNDLHRKQWTEIFTYAADRDTYIRKQAYTILGKIYKADSALRHTILTTIKELITARDEKIRQTAIYASGEIGKIDAAPVIDVLEKGLKDRHHAVRNGVIGALKQMGEKNPEPTIMFAANHIHDPDPEIRRQVIHGIELRGRTHPEDILPLLRERQHESHKRVKETIIHVLGQISYKRGGLEKVIHHLTTWENKEIVAQAVKEIITIHQRESSTAKTAAQAQEYIAKKMKDFE
ncbi:HEAT repeat domain-containing protein [candidate division CSSED10-310 bacterium]|uniref:HEAT repeat domain-containing protein n=1 Tax=candidate division CSSED10-310 bacterium TaxID=2855610 RepID=A0ABV6YR52_UNCC1